MSIQTVTKADVLRHFLARDIVKYPSQASELTDILTIGADEEFTTRLRDFAAGHDNGSPVYTWTGLNANQHHMSVVRWILVPSIDVREVYSKRINSNLEAPLQRERGNLARLAAFVPSDPVLQGEFDIHRRPATDEERTIIGVKHPCEGRQGSIELIDGAHRFVAMVSAGIGEVPAYLAELK